MRRLINRLKIQHKLALLCSAFLLPIGFLIFLLVAHTEKAGIIPGDRGKAGGSWCRPPLQTAKAEWQAYITSSSGRSRVRSVHPRTRN